MRNALAVTLLALGILIPQIGLGQAYINSSPNPSNYNQTVTFNTSLNYGCTGIMTIMDQGNTISQGNTDGNGNYSFQTSTLSPGTHSIIAHYDGEGECDLGNSSTLYQVVHAPSTTTSLSSNSNPSTYGGSVTFTATVAPSAATGTVTFKDGSASVGTGTLSRGTATLSISSLTGGSHSITAAYAGDGNYAQHVLDAGADGKQGVNVHRRGHLKRQPVDLRQPGNAIRQRNTEFGYRNRDFLRFQRNGHTGRGGGD